MVTKAITTKKPRTAAMVQKEFDDFKQNVIDTTMDYNAGCTEGKIEFLEDLGLEAPKQDARFNLTVIMPSVGEDPYDAQLDLENALKGSGITIDRYSLQFEDWL